jgi:hypothetical protein
MKDIDKFAKAIKDGIVTVEFRKIDTNELRVMPCTLNEDASDGNAKIETFNTDSDHFAVWCLDKKAWRSFRVSTVEKWYEGYPQEV